MKLFGHLSKIISVILIMLLVAPANMVMGAADAGGAKITHKPLKSYIPGSQITMNVDFKSDEGFNIVRCYFKAKDEAEYLFVDMMLTELPAYEGTLPAPWLGSDAINYFFLGVSESKKIIRSQVFEMEEEDTEAAEEWQEANNKEASKDELDKLKKKLKKELREQLSDAKKSKEKSRIQVKSEAARAPSEVAGFNDNIVITTVAEGERFGLMQAATVSAGAGGVSTGVLVGVAAAIGGGVAIASSGGSSDSGGGGVAVEFSNTDFFENIHILAPGEDYDPSNRLTPGSSRDLSVTADVGDSVTFRAGRNGSDLDQVTCTLTASASSPTLIWNGFTLSCQGW